MRPAVRTAAVTVVVAVLLAAVVAYAASDGGVKWAGLPVALWCALLAFAVNWLAFVPSWLARTEKFYDLTGTLTYLSVTGFALVAVGRYDLRSILLSAMVAIWAVRLGSFLFRRVIATGSDGRFDTIKQDPARLFMTWTLQGLWVFLTLCAALAAITPLAVKDVGPVTWVGLAVWIAGLAIEATADHQKNRFRNDPANDGGFITSGIWAWSRHPNYFGEIVLWTGVAVTAAGNLAGSRWITFFVSPLFVAVLLTKVSGIPLLEQRADKRWGLDDDYEAYKSRTPVLLPRPPRR